MSLERSLMVRCLSGIILVLVIVGMTLAWFDPVVGRGSVSFYLLWTVVGALSLLEYYRLVGQNVTEGARAAWYVVGTIYVAQAMGVIMVMNPMMVITLLTIVWMSDTGAYLVGVTIGKHKMAPTISPNKSWEGFFGGLLFAIGTALVWYALYWSPDVSPELVDQRHLFSVAGEDDTIMLRFKWLGFGVVVSLAATMGDLIESKFKRMIEVKDSGSIIPGHGGMLDRFDALFLAVPVAFIYIWLTGLGEL